MTDPRGTARWKKLRAQLIATATHCADPDCGRPLDHHAPPRSRWSPSVDHIIPIHQRPDLAFEPSNLEVWHFGCNSRKSARIRNHGTSNGNHRQHPHRWVL